jgi:hypothetical protein
MRKRRQGGNNMSLDGTLIMHENKYGVIKDRKPAPRDGHTAVIDTNGNMYVFGGDRHHMPFNDLFLIKLA